MLIRKISHVLEQVDRDEQTARTGLNETDFKDANIYTQYVGSYPVSFRLQRKR